VRIFLSYGHDDYASLASRIKHDLEELGHEVWFDVERLKPGGDWERYIAEGFEFASKEAESGRFLLLMTPHSVRRPDGYCFKELARAYGRNLPIIPVMVSTVEPPLSICCLQWLDMRQCFPAEQHEEQYKQRFGQLVTALTEKQVPFEGVQQRLLNYLQPMMYADDLARHRSRFTGRDWLKAEVEGWLASTKRVLWITGDAGVGKSAIAAWLCDHRPEITAYHFCHFDNTDRVDVRKALFSLAYQLSTQLPIYQDRLNASPLDKTAVEPNVRAIFDRLFVNLLIDAVPLSDKPRVLLIDALDEATRNGRNELASLIGGEFDRLPSWLRLIVTSRPYEQEINSELQALDPWKLDAGREENLRDIRTYLHRELRTFIGNGVPSDEVVDRIVDKSEGLFLYVTLVRDELEKGRLSLERLEEFPRGLGAVYLQWFHRYFPDIATYEADCRPALEAICAAREPLPRKYLEEVMRWSAYKMDSLAERLGSLFPFVGADERVRPVHRSLRDWLTDRKRPGAFRVDVQGGEQRLADFALHQYRSGVGSMSDYSVLHAPSHFAACQREASLKELLFDYDWLAARLRQSDAFGLSTDFNFGEPSESKRKVQHALVLSSQALSADRHQLGSQLIGRLLDDEDPQIRHLLIRAERSSSIPWLCPLHRSLTAPLGWLQVRLFGHEEGVEDLVVTQDGTRLISGARDGTIRIWDLVGNEPCRILKGHTEGISALALEPASGYVVSASWDHTLRVWDLDSGQTVQTLRGHTECVLALNILPTTGQVVSSGPDGTIRIWDVRTGAEVRRFSNFSMSVFDLAITPDEKYVLCVGYDEAVKIVDLQSGSLVRRLVGHADGAAGHAIAVSDDGHYAMSASHDKTLKIWDLGTCEEVRTLTGHTGGVKSVLLFPGGRLALSGAHDGTVRMWDLQTGENTCVFYGHEHSVNVVTASPTGAQAFSGSEDGSVVVWNLNKGSSLPSRISGGVASMAISKDRRQVLIGNFWGELHFLDVQDPSRSKVLTGHEKDVQVAATSDGRWAVSSGQENTLRIWNLEQLTQVLCFPTAIDSSGRVAISDDGRRAAYADKDNLITWDLTTGNELRRTHREEIKGLFAAISITSDGRFVIVPSKAAVNFHDAATHEVVRSLTDCREVREFALSLNDRLIAVPGYNDIRLWDLTKPGPPAMLIGQKGLRHYVDITSDGRIAVTAGSDRLVRVWSVEHRNIIASFETEGQLCDCFVTNDGKLVVAAETLGTVHILRLCGSPDTF